MTDTAEHFDVLIVGAGLSGIGAGYHLQNNARARATSILEGRDAIGGTWDLFRYPGIRSDSDMYTLGYAFKPWTEAKAIADGPSILKYVRDTAASTASTSTSASATASSARPGRRRTRAGPSRPSASRAQPKRFTCNFLFLCAGYYNYEEGYTPEFPGGGFQGPDRPSAEMAGGPRLRRQARRGDRLGRDGGDAGAGDGQDRRTSPCCSARRPTWSRGRPRTRSPTGCASSARQARLRPHPLAQRAVRHVFLPALPAQARARKQLILGGVKMRSARTTTSTRTSRRATIRGTSGCAWCRTATCSRRSATRRLRGHRPHRDLHRDRHQAEVRQRARRRHHRHRDRPEPAGARRPRSQRRRPHGRSRANAELQGHDVLGRAEPGLRVRLHQRVVDAEVRPDLRIRLPAAQPHGRNGYRSARRATSIPIVSRSRGSTSRPATSSARSPSSRSRARSGRGSCTRTTRSTS